MKILALAGSLVLSITIFGQSGWLPFVGIQVSGDAQLYYIGPSLQVGNDFKVKKRLFISSYIHYFPKNVNKIYTDGRFEKGKYRSATAALLIEVKLSKKEKRGLFLGGGAAVQKSSDDFKADWAEWHTKRTIIIPAIRFGYAFPLPHHNITIELNATGPYAYRTEENGFAVDSLEVLTQLSIGTRFIL